jgi:hypothetical protein
MTRKIWTIPTGEILNSFLMFETDYFTLLNTLQTLMVSLVMQWLELRLLLGISIFLPPKTELLKTFDVGSFTACEIRQVKLFE